MRVNWADMPYIMLKEFILMQLLSMNYGRLNCRIFFIHLLNECRYFHCVLYVLLLVVHSVVIHLAEHGTFVLTLLMYLPLRV